MGNQPVLYGIVNIALGILLYVAFTIYVPEYLDSVGMPCKNEGVLSCGGFLDIVLTVSLIIGLVGLAQLVYWAIFERGREVDVNVRSQSGGEKALGSFRICPECNLTNEPAAKFCKECGASLAPKKAKK